MTSQVTEIEPDENDVLEYAKFLGMELPADNDLIHIAKEGLKAPVPFPWKACKTAAEEIFYYNPHTNTSQWDHPSDEFYKQKFLNERSKKFVEACKKDLSTPLASATSSKPDRETNGDKSTKNTCTDRTNVSKSDAILLNHSFCAVENSEKAPILIKSQEEEENNEIERIKEAEELKNYKAEIDKKKKEFEENLKSKTKEEIDKVIQEKNSMKEKILNERKENYKIALQREYDRKFESDKNRIRIKWEEEKRKIAEQEDERVMKEIEKFDISKREEREKRKMELINRKIQLEKLIIRARKDKDVRYQDLITELEKEKREVARNFDRQLRELEAEQSKILREALQEKKEEIKRRMDNERQERFEKRKQKVQNITDEKRKALERKLEKNLHQRHEELLRDEEKFLRDFENSELQRADVEFRKHTHNEKMKAIELRTSAMERDRTNFYSLIGHRYNERKLQLQDLYSEQRERASDRVNTRIEELKLEVKRLDDQFEIVGERHKEFQKLDEQYTQMERNLEKANLDLNELQRENQHKSNKLEERRSEIKAIQDEMHNIQINKNKAEARNQEVKALYSMLEQKDKELCNLKKELDIMQTANNAERKNSNKTENIRDGNSHSEVRNLFKEIDDIKSKINKKSGVPYNLTPNLSAIEGSMDSSGFGPENFTFVQLKSAKKLIPVRPTVTFQERNIGDIDEAKRAAGSETEKSMQSNKSMSERRTFVPSRDWGSIIELEREKLFLWQDNLKKDKLIIKSKQREYMTESARLKEDSRYLLTNNLPETASLKLTLEKTRNILKENLHSLNEEIQRVNFTGKLIKEKAKALENLEKEAKENQSIDQGAFNNADTDSLGKLYEKFKCIDLKSNYETLKESIALIPATYENNDDSSRGSFISGFGTDNENERSDLSNFKEANNEMGTNKSGHIYSRIDKENKNSFDQNKTGYLIKNAYQNKHQFNRTNDFNQSFQTQENFLGSNEKDLGDIGFKSRGKNRSFDLDSRKIELTGTWQREIIRNMEGREKMRQLIDTQTTWLTNVKSQLDTSLYYKNLRVPIENNNRNAGLESKKTVY